VNWYDKVSKDISNIPDAVTYYETELLAAKIDCKVSGSLEKISQTCLALLKLDLTNFKRLKVS
jgi:hypothetical protein